MNIKNKYRLTNPYFFWGLIVIVLVAMVLMGNLLQSNQETIVEMNNSSIVEQSYSVDEDGKKIVVDPDNIRYMDIEKNSVSRNDDSLLGRIYTKLGNNSIIFLLLFYTVVLSLLFIYREKQSRQKIYYMEKLDDERRIQLAKKESPTIYKGLWEDFNKYRDVFAPEVNIDELEKRMENNARYVIGDARFTLEKMIKRLYYKHFDHSEERVTLDNMMSKLYKKRILNNSMNNYAHTIKAFGNQASHPNIDMPDVIESKDVLVVVTTLLQLLKEFESADYLKV